MNKPSILKSVSISEMLHMRDAGLKREIYLKELEDIEYKRRARAYD